MVFYEDNWWRVFLAIINEKFYGDKDREFYDDKSLGLLWWYRMSCFIKITDEAFCVDKWSDFYGDNWWDFYGVTDELFYDDNLWMVLRL